MFKRRFHRKRFSRPVAHRELLWVTSKLQFTETAGSPSLVLLAQFTQWATNATSGNNEKVKVVRCNLFVSAVVLPTAESRLYTLRVDDVTSAAIDPTLVASYSNADIVHQGVLYAPANAAAQGPVPLYNGYQDNLRSLRINRNVTADKALIMDISPATAAGDQLTFTVLARCLIMRS